MTNTALTYYAVAAGQNVADEGLTRIEPQPRCPGLIPVSPRFSAYGDVYNYERFYAELHFDYFEDADAYVDVLELFGLDAALYDAGAPIAVTVTLPNRLYAWTRYNARVAAPILGREGRRDRFFLRDFVLVLTRLAEASTS